MLEALRRFFARRRVSPEWQPEIRHVRIGNVTVGVNIYKAEELLKVATVWRCVSLLSNSVATLPWHVVRPDSNGNRLIQRDHPIEKLLNVAPNPEMTAFSMRTTLMHHKLLYGNAYAEIEVDGAGRAVALWPIAPDRVDPVRDGSGAFYYRVSQPRGGIAEIDPEFIFHVPGLAWDGILGYSVLDVALQSLGGSYAMDRFAGRYFATGLQPSGVIEVPDGVELTPEGMKRLRDEFIDKHLGWQKAQGPLILDQGMKYNNAMHEPDKAQLLETRKFSVFDVCRWFGVPPYLAFASDEEPRANVETQSREFLMYGLDPHITAFEQEADRRLFFGFRPPLASHMDRSEFQRGDLQTQSAFFKEMRHLGVFSVNDILSELGKPTIGPEGDVRVMQVQFQPIGADGAPKAVPQAGQPMPNGADDDMNGQMTNGALQ